MRAQLEAVILHELSYALPRFVQPMARQEVAAYHLMVIGWDCVQGDKGVMADAIERSCDTPGLSFADAYLAALAFQRQCPVSTKNARDLKGQGAAVPATLPSGA